MHMPLAVDFFADLAFPADIFSREFQRVPQIVGAAASQGRFDKFLGVLDDVALPTALVWVAKGHVALAVLLEKADKFAGERRQIAFHAN
jgi:hypothetical protein